MAIRLPVPDGDLVAAGDQEQAQETSPKAHAPTLPRFKGRSKPSPEPRHTQPAPPAEATFARQVRIQTREEANIVGHHDAALGAGGQLSPPLAVPNRCALDTPRSPSVSTTMWW